MKRENIQFGLQRAKKDGLRIVQPAPDALQIDLDGQAELTFYRQQVQVLRRNLQNIKVLHEQIEPSKSAGRFHVTIVLDTAINDITRVAFQAILGSDIRREAFNLCRVLNGNKYPIVFFEKEKPPDAS